MNVSGASSYASYLSRTPGAAATGGASSSFASTLNAAVETSNAPSGSGVQKTDFTHMTRKDLAEWVNSKIKSGEMSLDGTESFVGMTVHIPVNGGPMGLDDTEQVNFMQTAQDGMAWAQQHGDAASFKSLQTALATMQRYQGRISSVDLSA